MFLCVSIFSNTEGLCSAKNSCIKFLNYFITHRGEYGNSNNGIQYKGEFHSGKFHG